MKINEINVKRKVTCEFFEHIPFRFFAVIFYTSLYPTKKWWGCTYHPSSSPCKFEANWMMGNRAIIHAVHMVTIHAGFCFVLTKYQCSALSSQGSATGNWSRALISRRIWHHNILFWQAYIWVVLFKVIIWPFCKLWNHFANKP